MEECLVAQVCRYTKHMKLNTMRKFVICESCLNKKKYNTKMGKGMEIDTFTILGIEPVSAFQMLSHLSTLPLKTLKNNF